MLLRYFRRASHNSLGRHGTSYKSHEESRPTKTDLQTHERATRASERKRRVTRTESQPRAKQRATTASAGMESQPEQPTTEGRTQPMREPQEPQRGRNRPTRTDTRQTPSNTQTRLKPCTANETSARLRNFVTHLFLQAPNLIKTPEKMKNTNQEHRTRPKEKQRQDIN